MFDPSSIKSFRILPYEFDPASGVAKFNYAFDDLISFTEEFRFPVVPDLVNREALDRTLFMLSLVVGVSYYKAAVPDRAVIELGPVTQAELDYTQHLYFHGLGEFAYVNQLDLSGKPQFEAEVINSRHVVDVDVQRRSLVAVGGGKDSCVSIEMLRAGEGEILLASVNKARPIVDVMEASGLPSVHIERKISPELLRINSEGAYNGHIPVTAIVTLALVAASLIHRCDAVVMSNERSASVGNVEHNGIVVNHQYSKSLEAETMLSDLVRGSISPQIDYFSLLRPFSELEITRRFSKMVRYHDVFTSCNRAFVLDENRRIDRWCDNCPKCRFVFLALAPHMGAARLTSIFGANMLDDESQIEGFDALIGWNAHKPFECVGEVEESVAAFLQIAEQEQWREATVVKRFREEILPKLVLPADILAKPYEVSAEHHIPFRFQGLLDEVA